LLSSPGSTYLYYGEEIGMTQASDAEHIQRRAPMLWQNVPQAGFTSAPTSWVESADLFPPQQGTQWWQPFLQSQLNKKLTVAEQQSEANSLWSLYKYLIGQKHQRAEFGVAGTYQATALEDGKLMQIVRELNGSKTIMLLNLSDEAQAIPAEILKDRKLQPGWLETEASEQLPAWQLRTWQN
jgi:alpha-amylase